MLLAGHARKKGRTHLLVREAVTVPPDAYTIQAVDQLEVQPVFLASILKRARLDNLSLVLAHSHPFAGPVGFSLADDRGEAILMPTIFQRASDRPHGSLVVGPDGFRSRFRHAPQQYEYVPEVREVGRVLKIYGAADDKITESIYDRNVRAFGTVGQKTLARLKIAIVGLGGIGALVAEQLAHLGVGTLLLLDPDTIETTNLNRVVGASDADVGVSKVRIAERHVRTIRPGISVQGIQGSVNKASEAAEILTADLIFGCTDSHGSRAVLNQIAYQYFIPVVDTGVRIDAANGHVSSIVGRVQLLAPTLPCLQCHGLLDAEEVRRDLLSEEDRARDPYIVGEAQPQPAVISLNGVVASLAVTMALAVVTPIPINTRHQLYLAHRGVVRSVDSKPNPNCVICSLQGTLGRGDSWPLPWRPA